MKISIKTLEKHPTHLNFLFVARNECDTTVLDDLAVWFDPKKVGSVWKIPIKHDGIMFSSHKSIFYSQEDIKSNSLPFH